MTNYSFNNLIDFPITKSKAYIIGLIFPLIMIKHNFLIGSISHAYQSKLSTKERNIHYSRVYDFLKKDNIINSDKPDILFTNRGFIGKDGFHLRFILKNESINEINEVLKNEFIEICKSTEKIQKNLILGIFDGRSSIDKAYGYITLSVDKNDEKQSLIEKLCEKFNLQLNLNSTRVTKPYDQVRIKKNCITEYRDRIGFLSLRRSNDLNSLINQIK